MQIDEAESYFLRGICQLQEMCKDGAPWVFLCASAFLDYLANLEAGSRVGRSGYIKFIKNYMPKYKHFAYKDEHKDLPAQMYYTLRNGIVHNFSLVPDEKNEKNIGRKRSIVLAHRKSGKTHLSQHSSDRIPDAAVLIAEDFVQDIKEVVLELFRKAREESQLAQRIEKRLDHCPPIAGGF